MMLSKKALLSIHPALPINGNIECCRNTGISLDPLGKSIKSRIGVNPICKIGKLSLILAFYFLLAAKKLLINLSIWKNPVPRNLSLQKWGEHQLMMREVIFLQPCGWPARPRKGWRRKYVTYTFCLWTFK